MLLESTVIVLGYRVFRHVACSIVGRTGIIPYRHGDIGCGVIILGHAMPRGIVAALHLGICELNRNRAGSQGAGGDI